ncbi:ABC transporter ATP-binding protein [Microbacteriaceae bacterium 4G12]
MVSAFPDRATADSTAPAVSLSDISITYPGRTARDSFAAVRGVTFDVGPDEIVGLVGETGSGKSALLRTVAGFAGDGNPGSPLVTGGDATVLGQKLRRISRRQRTRLTYAIGYLPQDAGQTLNPQLTAGENVAEPIFSRDRRFDQNVAGKRVYTLIDAVALPTTVIEKFPHELSSGQRQRVAIARALVLGPRLLVADEPTSGVDVFGRGAILDLLGDLQRRGGFAALMVTHDLAVAARITQRIAVMHRGMLVGLGPVEQVLSNPTHPFVSGLAASRFLTGEIETIPGGEGSARRGRPEVRRVE